MRAAVYARYSGIFFITVAFFSCYLVVARELINSFDVTIHVQPDGLIQVTESIEVMAERVMIVHGLTRDIPTRYQEAFGTFYQAPVQVISVTRDGKPEPFYLDNTSSGIRIHTGSEHTMLPVGKHTFVIQYYVYRQIGHFDVQNNYENNPAQAHDELYWNVTGHYSRLPVLYAQARVYLPEGVPTKDIIFKAYTGPVRTRGQQYKAYVAPDKSIVFQTTAPLAAQEGLTIVVGWPPGFVQQPGWWMRIIHFVYDNPFFMYASLMTIIVMVLTVIALHSMRRFNKAGTIIPLFGPPDGISPAAARLLILKKIDEKSFAAQIVSMAVAGYLVIQYETTMAGGYQYTLKQTMEPAADMPFIQKRFLELLFGRTKSVVIDTRWEGRSALSTTYAFLKRELEGQSSRYFDDNAAWVGSIFFVSLLTVIPVISYGDLSGYEVWVAFIAGILLFCNLLVAKYSVTYTSHGRSLTDQLTGFKMYLSVAESDRMRIAGTPPTKTPALYEKFLPYAIALGVEEQWSHQFAPIFAKYAHTQQEYSPTWLIGGHWTLLESNALAFRLSRALSGAMSGSTPTHTPPPAGGRPGSTSGFGRGGSSGGGGGGGSVGGW